MAYDWGGSDVETDSQIISRLNKEKEALTKANKKLTKQLLIQGVGCSKITALVTYWLWQDSGHSLMDDYKKTFTKVVEVEKLTDINELFTNVAKIEILK
tara:strand:- start:573 stop:869 length:297 start_codon:yes stop_codon:yes gene_type:complete